MARTGVTGHALTPGDPRRTIHFVIAHAVASRRGGDKPFVGVDGDSMLAWSASEDDPDLRRSYAYQVSFGWVILAFAFGLAMLVVGVPVTVVVGDAPGNLVVEICLAACLFCCAGSANVLWRMYYFVPQAKRLARRGETDSEAYAAAMRRTLPRNSSLVFQGAVGILTFISTVASG
jgi:hypothetical protein